MTTTNTTSLSIADRLSLMLACCVTDAGTALEGKVKDGAALFGTCSINEKELKKELGFENAVPAEWRMTILIVCSAATSHHAYETLAKNVYRTQQRLVRSALEAQRPALLAEMAVLGVKLENPRLPTSELPGIITGARTRKGRQCEALLSKINQHREVLEEKAEELGVSRESTSEEIAARWTVLAAMEYADAERAHKRVQARADHMRRQAALTRELDRKRGVRLVHPKREAQAAATPKGPIVQNERGETRRIEPAKGFHMPDVAELADAE